MSEQWSDREEELLKRFQRQLQPGTGIDDLDQIDDDASAVISVPTLRVILEANRDLAAENAELRERVAQEPVAQEPARGVGFLLASAFVVGAVVGWIFKRK